MGSGETSPSMVELHKSLLGHRGPVTILDTPCGFQENVEELSSKAAHYFSESVGASPTVVSLRSADLPPLEIARGLAAIRRSSYVFAGPGSPTYALREWHALDVVDAFVEVVERGGVVTLASAASICAGELSLPVYEIYKAGVSPYWVRGLDLLGRFGIRATVLPHFNNTEGGTHDTSCCYVGRRRLESLRSQVPDLPVLGLDEHTALVIDIKAGVGRVYGQGASHLLIGDTSHSFATGATVPIRELLAAPASTPDSVPARADAPSTPLLSEALASKDPAGVLAALSEMARDQPALLAQLGEFEPLLAAAWTDRTQGFVDLLLAVRHRARESKQWDVADVIRDGLLELGHAVHDTPQGQQVRGSGAA